MDVRRPDADRGVYGISVAAELVGTGVQNLRAYERRGLLEPARTEGGTRRYSDDDLTRLRRIGELLDAGLNLAGVSLVLDLEDANARLGADNTRLRREKAEHQWLRTAKIRAHRSPAKPSPTDPRRSGPKQ